MQFFIRICRGIEKIFEACKEIGAEGPEYSLVGSGLRIKFKALDSANIDSLNDNEIKETSINNNTNGANGTNKIEIGTNNGTNQVNNGTNQELIIETNIQIEEDKKDKDKGNLSKLILNSLQENPTITQKTLADNLNIPLRTLKRKISKLKKENKISRIGNNRNGSWVVNL